MTFKNKDDFLQNSVLEGTLDEDGLDEIIDIENDLPEPTSTVLNYVRDMASVAHKTGLDEDYAVFGGYGVLAHLVSEYGNNITRLWRGSEDIDMVGGVNLLNTIRSLYNIHNDRPSQNIESKWTLKIAPADESEIECKIDYILGDIDLNETENITMLGVPVRVLEPIAMIKSKLEFYKQEDKQTDDIAALLGICENREMNAGNIVDQMSSEERGNLNDFLRDYRSLHQRVRTHASEDYLGTLKSYVKGRVMD